EITWWENDGEQGFTEYIIAGNLFGVCSVYAIDMDNDGDMDVLGAAFENAKITWWENDGEQDFTEHTIADSFWGAQYVYAADVDGDGDVDVLGAAYDADDVIWWESDLAPERIGETPHSDVPGEFTLLNAYPNPFNSTTRISYALPYSSYVSMQVYNISGQQITTIYEGYRQAGMHSATLSASHLPSGIYFVRLNASNQVFTQKVMLIR
ncbi:MAG: T9SS type A sorting domain-containing protein, partial [Calditrichaeota bacterium]|nr:T9SS type A sorting domain-containing protein [Calditrichota bacterium]